LALGNCRVTGQLHIPAGGSILLLTDLQAVVNNCGYTWMNHAVPDKKDITLHCVCDVSKKYVNYGTVSFKESISS